MLRLMSMLQTSKSADSNATATFADHAKELRRGGIVAQNVAPDSRKQICKPVYGKSQTSKVKSVKTVDVFMSPE